MPLFKKSATMVSPALALPGRAVPIPVISRHVVKQTPLVPPFPDGMAQVVLGMGCFWGAERKFWSLPGVFTTAVGYAGGYTANPSYEDVCTGRTGHTEVVLVVFDPSVIVVGDLLTVFWENHDPTQGLRQGNDVGSQYRSFLQTANREHYAQALDSRHRFDRLLSRAGFEPITTEIIKPEEAKPFYYAEDYHQQYLAKNPDGYCGLGGTGVRLCS